MIKITWYKNLFGKKVSKKRVKKKSKFDLKKYKKDMALELSKLIKENKKYKRDLKRLISPDYEKANFWNNKWKKAPILYTARNNKLYDVRTFITFPSIVLEEARRSIKAYPKDSNDLKALKILKFAIDNFIYKPDSGEYWSFPTDFLHSRHGDCEDGTHLIVSLLRNAGIPAYRIKVACGWAINRKTKQRIGHSYPIYLRESDDEWVHLDWCFYPNKDLISKRVLAKNNKDYGEIWFTFNDIFSWAQKDIEITEGKIKDFELR